MITAISATVLLTQQKPTAPPIEMKELQLVLLERPSNLAPMSPDAAGQLQKQHLGFLENLYQTRKALAVGPLEDKKLAGIVIMDVGTPDKAKSILSNEPTIKAGRLKPVVLRWYAAANYFAKGPKFLDLEPLWFGLLSRTYTTFQMSKEESDALGTGHMANINRMADMGILKIAGPFVSEGKLRGVFVFNCDQETVLKETAQDPTISKGVLKLTLYRWYTAKSTFVVPK